MSAKSAIEIAWVAGLLEGEGTFSSNEDGTCPSIILGMTDYDVVLVSHVEGILG